ncbi:hypothetical protein Desaci_1310 [Desulfosporosinus acidiphilus SJ4]|uniref:Uncharacterized protein n=1 Tax=Desulfosporosinus acidiphilus (strain DSM 22704 / JCM 16185 / SJ4) TaxID=646529 RepID=I4D3G2_DESAJ|nr:hypothetical protein [Desulfosporosinus acidiphilus]AFM40336.1 hypothetical protein Desaci_1310 [Desulfosporosinus acidiphilus SJ4]
MQTAYLLFKYKNMSPKEFYDKKPGEKKILRAFLFYELAERNRENSS